MKGERNSATVNVLVVAMTARLTDQDETISLHCGNKLASRERAESAVVNFTHTVTETSGSS